MDELDIKKALVAYGLEERQARIFLALIKRVEATATELVKDTSIPRATVYLDLESLHRAGLVSTSKKNGVAYFTPESLNKLTTTLQQKTELMLQALPFIKQLEGRAGRESTIRLIQGREGIISIWEELLEAYRGGLRESYGFTNIAALIELMPRFFPEWLQQEAHYPVAVRLLTVRGASAEHAIPNNPNMHIKYVPEDYAYPGEMTIYGNRVVFFHVEKENPHAFVIDSPEVAEMQKKIFMLLWNTLE